MPRTGFERTPPAAGGGVGLLFTIEKSNFIAGAKQTGKALTDMQREINANFRSKGYSVKTTSNAYGANITVKALTDALEDSTQEWAKIVAAGGKARFKEVIKSAPNIVKPSPGRIDTHLMLNSVRGTTTRRKYESTVEIGWTGTYYRYFSFQEDGTRNGPMPMHAIPKTAKYITNEFNRSFGRILQSRMTKIK